MKVKVTHVEDTAAPTAALRVWAGGKSRVLAPGESLVLQIPANTRADVMLEAHPQEKVSIEDEVTP